MDRQGRWSISPAYDLTFSYNPNNRWISEHQMKINNKTNSITDDDMITCGTGMGLSKEYCRETIEKARIVVDHWDKYAEKAGISERRTDEIRNGIRKCIES